jgi:hypothetical protein
VSKSSLTSILSASSPPLIDCFAINCRAKDAAYGSGPMLDWLVNRDIKPHIPVLDHAGRKDGTWSPTDFEWDAENTQYICPEGEALKQFRHNYSDPNRGPTGKGIAKYWALKHIYQDCPSKMKCCQNTDARQVARDISKTKQYVVSMKPRKKGGSERGSKCSSPTSNASSSWEGSDYEGHVAQMMNSSSPQQPKTSAN